MKPNRYTWDIETFPNYFLIVFKDYVTKEFIEFEISEWQNDIHKIYNFCNNKERLQKEIKDYYVGFNSLHFDGPVLNYVIKEYHNLCKKDGWSCAFAIWELAQLIINDRDVEIESDEQDNQLLLFPLDDDSKVIPFDTTKYIGQNFEKYKRYRWINNWITVDLFLYWSKLVRQSRKISLKGLACHMDWHWIQELPLHPTSIVEQHQVEDIKLYCRNDVNITEALLDKLKGDVNFRSTLVKEFGNGVLSWDGPKIGLEALAKTVAEKSGLPLQEIKGHKTIRKSLNLKDIIIDVEFD